MKRTWEHQHITASGTCLLYSLSEARARNAEWHLLEVSTGRSQVWDGYGVEILCNEGEWLGRSRGNGTLREALFAVDGLLRRRESLCLRLAGLQADWSESGLSFNSGYGYRVKHGGGPAPIFHLAHLMDPVFESELTNGGKH